LASRCPIQDDIVLELKGMLEDWGLVVAPEKIQRQPPWKYLGMTLTETVIRPQKLTIRADNVKTLNDVQKLVGDLQWIRNVCGITNMDLQPLYELLQDGKDPHESRQLTQPVEAALQNIVQKISHGSISRMLEGSPIQLYIFMTLGKKSLGYWLNGGSNNQTHYASWNGFSVLAISNKL